MNYKCDIDTLPAIAHDFAYYMEEELGLEFDIQHVAVAEPEEMDDAGKFYTSFYLQVPTDLEVLWKGLREVTSEYASCGHSYDCCGCVFLQMARILNVFEADKEAKYIVVYESYGRNY